MPEDSLININNYSSLYKPGTKDEQCANKGMYSNEGFFAIDQLQRLKPLQKNVLSGSVRRSFYTVILLTAGAIEETLNYVKYRFEPGTLYFIPANVPTTIHEWSEDIEGYHCVFDADYFLLCEKNQVRLNSFQFFDVQHQPFIALSTSEQIDILNSFNTISAEYCESRKNGNDQLVKLYLNALLTKFERLYSNIQNKINDNPSRKDQITANFKKLVSQHAGRINNVSSFAELLNITPHYLNDTVREVTGMAASVIIQTHLISLAKSYLVQTDRTVMEIASALNFSDHSYFSRFFKKQTGVTPLQFRRSHKI
jgi:AraC-like DNA-binding protein